MNEVLRYMLCSSKPLLEETELAQLIKYDQHEWQQLINQLRGMIVTYPGMVRPNMHYASVVWGKVWPHVHVHYHVKLHCTCIIWCLLRELVQYMQNHSLYFIIGSKMSLWQANTQNMYS